MEKASEQPVGVKRKGEDPAKASENPKKKQKLDSAKKKQKRAKVQPCEIRVKIQNFFKDKNPESEKDIAAFLESEGVKRFKDFWFPERSFKAFITEHNISWDGGNITGPSDDFIQEKLQAQMEFYFSDGNLPRDKFLKNEISKSEERWVKLAVFKKFKLVQKWSDKTEDLVKALAKSGFLQLDAKQEHVRRITPLTITRLGLMKRTTIVHGFKFLKGRKNLPAMKKYFEQYGAVAALFPRVPKRGHLGAVEIIWVDEPTAEAFRDKKTINYEGTDFTINQTKAWEHFEKCFRLEGGKFDGHTGVKTWLRDLGVAARKVETSGELIYVWANTYAKEAVNTIKNAKEKENKYGVPHMLKEEEYDLVKRLMKHFEKPGKKNKPSQGKKKNSSKEDASSSKPLENTNGAP